MPTGLRPLLAVIALAAPFVASPSAHADDAVGPDATVTAFQPKVMLWHSGAPEWIESKTGDVLSGLDQLRTLAGATVALRLRDQSVLQLGENGALTIEDSREASRTKHRSSAVELASGELRIKAAGAQGTFVATPSAQVTASTATITVSVDAQKTTRVGVLHGSATVVAQGQSVEVEEGSGTTVAAGSAPAAPQPAPDPPSWTAGSSFDTVLAVKRTAPVTVQWGESLGAAAYRVEVSRDDAFSTHVLDRTVPATEPRKLDLPQAEIGRYFARVSAISSAGLEGAPSSTKMIDVRQLILEAGGAGPKPGTLFGAVSIRVRMPEGLTWRAVVDGVRTKENPVVIRGMGEHQLQVTIGSGPPQMYACTIEVPRVQVVFTKDLRQVVIRFFDRQGRPVSFVRSPDLNIGLRGQLGTRTFEPEPVGDGHEWRAEVTPYQAMSTQIGVAVQVIWNGEPIGGGHAEASVE